MDERIIVFTIAARNYLGLVSVLFDSVRAHCPDIDLRCFVVDGFEGLAELPEALRAVAVDCRRMGIPRFEEMAFKYDVVEFSTSIKPFVFRHLFEVERYGGAVFLDPDIRVYEDLRWAQSLLETHSVAVTPHLIDMARNDPAGAGGASAYGLKTFLFAGDFNLGFIAIRNDARGSAFVDWWANVLASECFFDLDQGLCVDQKWVNLAVGFFGNELGILRDPGVNVAFWNVHERQLTKDPDGRYRVDGSSLKFVHFSSLDVSEDALGSMRIAGGRIDGAAHAVFAELYSAYAREALAAGHRERRKEARYRFDSFEDGSPINRLHRRLYAARVEHEDLPTPFATSGPYYSLLQRSGLLDKGFKDAFVRSADVKNLGRKRRLVELVFRALYRVLGTKRYMALLIELRRIAALRNNTFLLK